MYRWVIEILAAQADHSKCDCFLVAALTHGDSGRIHARDHQYPPDELWEPFSADKCPTLAGKPKMFLIQVGHNIVPSTHLAFVFGNSCEFSGS